MEKILTHVKHFQLIDFQHDIKKLRETNKKIEKSETTY